MDPHGLEHACIRAVVAASAMFLGVLASTLWNGDPHPWLSAVGAAAAALITSLVLERLMALAGASLEGPRRAEDGSEADPWAGPWPKA